MKIDEIIKELKECIATLADCGPAPVAPMGVCTFNGTPVQGKSTKKKKKRVNEGVYETVYTVDTDNRQLRFAVDIPWKDGDYYLHNLNTVMGDLLIKPVDKENTTDIINKIIEFIEQNTDCTPLKIYKDDELVWTKSLDKDSKDESLNEAAREWVAQAVHASTGYGKKFTFIPAMGTDAVLTIDGRLSESSARHKAAEYFFNQLKLAHPSYLGFTIAFGEFASALDVAEENPIILPDLKVTNYHIGDQIPDEMLTNKQKELKASWMTESLNEEDDKFNYMMLDRLKQDCEYYLGYGNGYEGHLWAGNVEDQIAKMKELYNKVPEKPEWLSLKDIDNYERQMLAKRDSKVESYKEGDRVKTKDGEGVIEQIGTVGVKGKVFYGVRLDDGTRTDCYAWELHESERTPEEIYKEYKAIVNNPNRTKGELDDILKELNDALAKNMDSDNTPIDGNEQTNGI